MNSGLATSFFAAQRAFIAVDISALPFELNVPFLGLIILDSG